MSWYNFEPRRGTSYVARCSKAPLWSEQMGHDRFFAANVRHSGSAGGGGEGQAGAFAWELAGRSAVRCYLDKGRMSKAARLYCKSMDANPWTGSER